MISVDYAKLMRKRDKAGPDGRPVHIDLETLRASTRLANEKDKAQVVRQKRPQDSEDEQASSSQKIPEQSQQHSSPSPENMKVESPDVRSYSHFGGSTAPSQQHPPSLADSSASNAPPSSWPSNTSSRGYASEQQSFMRSAPSHPR